MLAVNNAHDVCRIVRVRVQGDYVDVDGWVMDEAVVAGFSAVVGVSAGR